MINRVNYLERKKRICLLEFHVLHFALDVGTAAGGVVLRLLHLLVVTDQADVNVPVSIVRSQ